MLNKGSFPFASVVNGDAPISTELFFISYCVEANNPERL